MLDILYIWAVRKRGRTSLYRLLKYKKNCLSRIIESFRKDIAKDKLKKDNQTKEYTELLFHLFDPQRAQMQLSEFIMEKYTDNEIITLTELINENIVNFHYWLKKLR